MQPNSKPSRDSLRLQGRVGKKKGISTFSSGQCESKGSKFYSTPAGSKLIPCCNHYMGSKVILSFFSFIKKCLRIKIGFECSLFHSLSLSLSDTITKCAVKFILHKTKKDSEDLAGPWGDGAKNQGHPPCTTKLEKDALQGSDHMNFPG